MAWYKFCSDGSDGSLAHVIGGQLEAMMTHAECIAMIANGEKSQRSVWFDSEVCAVSVDLLKLINPIIIFVPWCHMRDVDERWQAGDRDIENRLT